MKYNSLMTTKWGNSWLPSEVTPPLPLVGINDDSRLQSLLRWPEWSHATAGRAADVLQVWQLPSSEDRIFVILWVGDHKVMIDVHKLQFPPSYNSLLASPLSLFPSVSLKQVLRELTSQLVSRYVPILSAGVECGEECSSQPVFVHPKLPTSFCLWSFLSPDIFHTYL